MYSCDLYISHRTFSLAQLYKVSTHCAFSPPADEHTMITMGDFLSLNFLNVDGLVKFSLSVYAQSKVQKGGIPTIQ